MAPLNNNKLKTEKDEDGLRENFSQQELVRNAAIDSGSSSETVTIENSQNWSSLSRQQIITVVVLCYVNLINYMDRYTVAGLLFDIGKAFDLREGQLGFLQTAFILVYMFMAPLYGFLGDRYNRKYLMASGVFIWSFTTLLGSFMPSYEWFLLMRCFVGIGEASYSTIAPTLLSDIFVSDMRSKMLAIFYFAIPVGSGLGYIIGAEVSDIAENYLPDDKDIDAWRWGLRVTPVMGLIAVILILFVLKEPPRGECEGGEHLKATSFFSDLKYIFTNRSFMLSTIAFTCITYVAGALAWWGPKYVELGTLVQDHPNVKHGNVSFVFGLVAMIAGLVGVPLGSYAGQKFRVKYPAADPIVCGLGALFSLPLLVGGMILAGINSIWAFVVVLFGQIFLNLNWAVVSDMVLYICIPTRRAAGEAFNILISHAFGDAGSPYIVGLVAEAFKPMINSSSYGTTTTEGYTANFTMATSSWNTTVASTTISDNTPEQNYVDFKALQYSLIICVLVEILATFFFFLTARYIAEDKESCNREIAGADGGALSLPQPSHRFADEVETEQRIHLIT